MGGRRVTIERVRVGEVLRLQRRAVVVDPTMKYRLIGIYSFGKGLLHREPKLGLELGDYRFFAIEPGDLVLSNIQAWEGAIGHATEADKGFVGTHRFLSYVPIDGRIDTNWARWFFLSDPGMELIRQAAPGTTMRNRTLAIDRFEALEIPLPPIDEQRRVAAYLGQMATTTDQLRTEHSRQTPALAALHASVRTEQEEKASLTTTKLNEVLQAVRHPIGIQPTTNYVTIGLRSFGKGLFHYQPRLGTEIGKLRYQSVVPRLLIVSNIKAWEGAVATTEDADAATVASNRFLLFRPTAGEDATEYFWSLLLGHEGIAALGHASPGSADRNRTLSVGRFLDIELNLPGFDHQVAIGRRLRELRHELTRIAALAGQAHTRIDAMIPAALNDAFAGLS